MNNPCLDQQNTWLRDQKPGAAVETKCGTVWIRVFDSSPPYTSNFYLNTTTGKLKHFSYLADPNYHPKLSTFVLDKQT